MKLLIVEDEPKTGNYLRQGLIEAGYVVDLACNGVDGLHLAGSGEYQLIILDVMLPGLDGWNVLSRLREAGWQVPVLFLTARSSIADRVQGLELGADDYLAKPFAFAELLARVRTLLAAGQAQPQAERIVIADLVVDTLRRRVERGGQRIALSQKEYTCWSCWRAAGRSAAALADRLAGVGHELRQRHQRDRRGDPPPAREDRR
jgi:two-component system copper resistance phosphate regulon response regulator CusR